MSSFDPYRVPSGQDLDTLIHARVMGRGAEGTLPAYSSERKAALKVIGRLESLFGIAIVYGETSEGHSRSFARYGVRTGRPTEVVADSLPLAICRLALVCMEEKK
jgi:hypothetical protein